MIEFYFKKLLETLGRKKLNSERLNERRRKATDYLRENPEGIGQHHGGVIERTTGNRCALGLLAIPFGVEEPADMYNNTEDLLGIDYYTIVNLNDLHNKTFSQITDILESRWFGNDTSAAPVDRIREDYRGYDGCSGE